MCFKTRLLSFALLWITAYICDATSVSAAASQTTIARAVTTPNENKSGVLDRPWSIPRLRYRSDNFPIFSTRGVSMICAGMKSFFSTVTVFA